jgi:signal transduction histidine kinase
MRDAVENAQPAASAKGLTLTLRSPKSVMIDGDPTKVRDIVFKNLLENAIHYTDHGSVTVEVSQGNGRALVRITDTGIGISGEDMRRLFTPGGRGETARAKNPHSTGYGLYISKQIVEAHGGRLWLESDGPGTGTRTYVELAVAA